MEKNQRLVLVLLLFVTSWVATEGADYLKYKDPNQPLAVRINDLIRRMTLQEKIGQMAMIERGNASSDVLKNYFIGGVLYEAESTPGPEASAKVWVDHVNEMQKAAISTRLGIPLTIGNDAIHGQSTIYNATIFPHNIGLGATRDPALVKKIGAATALEVRATGIPYTLAPCIAVCRDPRWGRCYESYSEDPKVVEMMTEIIPGLQGEIPQNSLKGVPFVAGKNKIAACAKHYVGDGGTQGGIDENNTIATFHELLSIHMPPFDQAVIKGISSVMVSFSSWNGVRMHANHYLLTDFLKNKLRFRGFIISDFQGIDDITTSDGANYTYSLQIGILAGIDMIMIPFDYRRYNESFIELVNNGIIPMNRIDDAVRRILRVKFQMGLFEYPMGDYSMMSEIGKQEHRDIAREAVRKSLVLLKNGKTNGEPLLPLSKKAKKILVVGSHADNLGYQCGAWTIEWQGFSGNNLTIGTTMLDAIRSTVDVSTEVVYYESPDESIFQNNEFSYAIVAVGELPYAEDFGDSSNLTIANNGSQTIQNVCKNVKCVVVLITGRPVVIEPYVNEIDALVAAWLPGSEGHGMTDVLFGDYGFTGKLSRTWFKSVDQLPMNVGDAHYDPLYPFDFGLTTEPLKTT